eukprot:TRINITY_DN30806_c0_g1_i1.p3 TRINITY_DN30806_c0_g1~~TRINITY_DN30806_c0_g1_i1.p3  ORF type:complete len:138 (+),score=43.20 TRINITY_DN30806_c0_g1_i1:54-416(+)
MAEEPLVPLGAEIAALERRVRAARDAAATQGAFAAKIAAANDELRAVRARNAAALADATADITRLQAACGATASPRTGEERHRALLEAAMAARSPPQPAPQPQERRLPASPLDAPVFTAR